MRRGIIIEHTLVDKFDGNDIHMRDELTPNTNVEILDIVKVYGIDYAKIKYNNEKVGYIDMQCIIEAR